MYGSTDDSVDSLKVAVIGAGVAGVATASMLRSSGVEDVVVFEQQSGLGGLWMSNYPGCSVQTSAELYEYPDKKFPDFIRNRSDPPAPTAKEVCAYLEEYVKEKGIGSFFRFNTQVLSVRKVSDGHWKVRYISCHREECEGDFTNAVICTGRYSSEPNKPSFVGEELFVKNGGTIMHTSEWKSYEQLKDKRIVVVGNGKSAVDAAIASAQYGKAPPVQIARRTQWYFPRFLMGLVHYKYAFHSRLGSALFPRYYEVRNPTLKVIHLLTTPLKWLFWRLVEAILYIQYFLPSRIAANANTIESSALEASSLVTSESPHLKAIRSGEVDLRITTIRKLKTGAVELANGDEIPCDVLILGTGWKQSYNFLDGSVASKLDLEDDGLWLYRNILPPKVPGLAFVGSNVVTFTHPFTCYLQALWLARYLVHGNYPALATMNGVLADEKCFKQKTYPKCYQRGASVGGYMQYYHDVLMEEMGEKPMHFNGLFGAFANWMLPVVPSMYDELASTPHAQG